MGSYSDNDYRSSPVLLAYSDMGLKMCGRYCLYHKSCTAVNYNSVSLVCELLAGSAADPHSTVLDFKYSAIDTWSMTDDPCYPNTCSENERCARTKRESYYCMITHARLYPKDCDDILATGQESGVYTIYIDGTLAVEVFCDMQTDGGGYTVFQNRYDGSVDFYNNRTWASYKYGFGNLYGEFWLGLEYIYQMTKTSEYMLRVDLEDNYGATAYAEYSTFRINSEADLYRLIIAGYSGTAGDPVDTGGKLGMLYNHNVRFSSPDNATACTLKRKGGWWHLNCSNANLNGVYNPGVSSQDSMFWYGFKNRIGLKKASMKVKKK
ncbi:Angiopoietin-related protein 7,Ficolin-3,Ficolin-1-B,Ficolin-2,Ryncolin-1,Tenascin-R,Angiopoietin-1,Ficolin-1,Fibrinogen C domain-containing protein 1-A,Tenascin-X,Ryncolin-3,Fibroleukin,Fibrinogen C domain-containing protein 1,Ryncolin-2,Microfibril-associated glycoprotein 4,Fibrinogen alpha chain,Ficolin-1-A,Tenascin,Fibrinogen C domain-containing protein 1-B,Angiopoietin-4 [Mytilus coruscus]|uniref:Fibrinogen C-terminal domain-containing protein n=1 Tax=Mytilus coruscus TaxID=42192 RepID=A0A6J8AY20_MYTCO|nr:Angiopoietin-related protein 7,Ficolin-3,Ficolin-1-B,Ficolin-2,Ryncolin-1,Tenascin-R,Angiopoietin-1,Ficolin-1,Fibrinogen C domain-containing protein 1-A,Tenascin-X,Ryncolin-3,Fibroleukin,Fibrinogen C domain-containing protein 1,Ryncolin-2,Microfibril-associated glycoprotein 4,Fibrinogen alpha chain,Ficolin-1-A,Tenascin,Fibrinogen C domain-containing protein 1-B,Angiopoietin-4 [Mytilus coruscus]